MSASSKTEVSIFHVAPHGRDPGQADGSPENPLSLFAARDFVRRHRAATGETPMEVRLHGGVYEMSETLVFTGADSGTAGAPICWRAAPGELPVLRATSPLTGWRRLDHALPGLPRAASEHVWYADAPGRDIRTLYDAGGMLKRAAIGPLTSDPAGDDLATPTTLHARMEDLRDWSNLRDLELFIKPLHVWQAQFLPVAAMDFKTGIITTSVPGTYKLVANGKKIPALEYWIENVPEGLDSPGCWLRDSTNRRIYLWPRTDSPTEILAPTLTELVRFEAGPDDEPCRHLVLEGVEFRHGDRLGWPVSRRALQHDWQLYDWPDAMVRLGGARDIVLRDCRFADAGATGLRMDGFAVGNTVERCTFEALGGNAVALVGDEPGRGERTHHNRILQNQISDIGRLWWQASGILVAQASHNLIANNHLWNLPYCGITLISGREGAFHTGNSDTGMDGRVIREGSFGDSPREFQFTIGHLTCRQNIVEHNEVHDVMQRMGDGNGIYISGTGWGNIIRCNFVHDLPAAGVHSGIRIDDMQWYTLVEKNLVCRINGGGITLKDINDVTDNVVVACAQPAMLVRRSPSWGANIRRNIFVADESVCGETPEGSTAPFYGGGGMGGRLAEPNIDDNLLWSINGPVVAEGALKAMRALGKDLHSIAADPLFLDADRGDYRLRADSPALKLGIRSLESWGVR